MPTTRFQFRAAVVLDLRARRDRDAQDSLKTADSAVRAGERALQEAHAAVAAACARAREPGTDPEWYRAWMIGLRAAVARRAAELAQRVRARDEATVRALEARRALRVIERLRDRRLRAFEREMVRREQREIDELGTRRFHARSTQ